MMQPGMEMQPPNNEYADVQGYPAPQTQAPMAPVIFDKVPLLDADTAGKFAAVTGWRVRQKVKLAEAVTQGCIEQSNEYDVFNMQNNDLLFHVKENSEDMARCCCAPNHPLKLEVARPEHEGGAVVMTMTRDGIGCCYCGKWLGCCACMDCCTDGMQLHAGQFQGDPQEWAGNLGQIIGAASVPIGGGTCTPTLQIKDHDQVNPELDDPQPYVTITGPTCFGGCSEFCCDQTFNVTRAELGDVAEISKKKPADMKDIMKEAFTDSDHYEMYFKDGSLTPQQKATMLGALLLTDYMFFERDNDMCRCDNGNIIINMFNLYCFGCVCPCEFTIPTGSKAGE